MIISVGSIAANATLGITNFVGNADKVMERAVRIQKTFNSLSHQVAAVGRTFTIVAIGGNLAARAIGSSFIKAAADMEEYNVVMQSITKSTEATNAIMADLTTWARQTPFDLQEVISSGVVLAATFKGNTDEVRRWLPALQELGAISKLRKIDFEQMTDQFVRLISQGAGAVDLFRDRGILKMLGIDANIDKDLVKLREKLYNTLTDVDGIFAGMSDKLAGTFTGVLSQVIDQWTIFKNEVMTETGLFDNLKSGLITTLDVLEANRKGIVDFIVANKEMIEDIVIGTVVFLGLAAGMTALGFVIPPIVESFSLFTKTILALRAGLAGIMTLFGVTAVVAAPMATAIMAAGAAAGILTYVLRANEVEVSKLAEQYYELSLGTEIYNASTYLASAGTGNLSRFVASLTYDVANLGKTIIEVLPLLEKIPGLAGSGVADGANRAVAELDKIIAKAEDTMYMTNEEIAQKAKETAKEIFESVTSESESFLVDQGGKIAAQVKKDFDGVIDWARNKFPLLDKLMKTGEGEGDEPINWEERLGKPNFNIPDVMQKAAKKGVDKAAKELERLQEEGRRIYRDLFPVEGASFDVGEKIRALLAADLASPAAMQAMQNQMVEGWQGTYDELVKLEERLLGMGGNAALVGAGITEAWVNFKTELDAVDMVSRDALMEFSMWDYQIGEFTNRLTQLDFIAQQLNMNLAPEDTTRALEDLMSALGVDTVQEIDRLRKAVGDLRPEFKQTFDNAEKEIRDIKVKEQTEQFFRFTDAVGGLGPKFKTLATVAETSFRIIRAAQAAASLGFTEILNLVIEIISAMGLLGGETEKSMSDMDKFMDDLASVAEDVADRMTDAIVQFARTGKAEIGDLADYILSEFLRAGISNLIVNPAVDFVGDALFAKGGAFWKGNLIPAAKGHVTDGPEMFRFKSGQMGVRGEAGSEAILPLTRINGVLGVNAKGGGTVVNIYNNALPPEAVSVNRYQADGREIVDIVLNIVKTGLMDGSLSGALKVAR